MELRYKGFVVVGQPVRIQTTLVLEADGQERDGSLKRLADLCNEHGRPVTYDAAKGIVRDRVEGTDCVG